MSATALADAPLSPYQRHVVSTAWIVYGCYYLGRLNLSPAIPALATAFAVSRAEVGWLGTALFWTYGVGQFISGVLGNRYSPRLLIAGGLLVSAVINLLMGVQVSLLVMILLWGINGLAQSTGWAPLLRILSEKLSVEQRRRVSVWLPISFQVGGAVTWALAGFAVVIGGWQMAFWLPGLLLIGVLIFWWRTGIDSDVQTAAPSAETTIPVTRLRSEIVGLLPLMIVSACVGFAFAGAAIWIPTYIVDSQLFPEALNGAVAGSLPLIGILGTLLSGLMIRRIPDVLVTVLSLLGVSTLCYLLAAALPIVPQMILVVLALTALSGGAGLTLSAIPMLLARAGRTSSVAGALTSTNSLGGGLAGFLIGAVVESSGWPGAMLVWGISLMIAIGLLFWYQRRQK